MLNNTQEERILRELLYKDPYKNNYNINKKLNEDPVLIELGKRLLAIA